MNIDEALKVIYKNDAFPMTDTIADKDLEAYFADIDLTITGDQFAEDKGEFELTESICSDKDLAYGKCNASKVKFTLANVDDDIKGKEFVLTQIVNDTYSMPLGIFMVDTVTKQDDLIFKDIVAYDRMKKIEVDVADWYNGLTFPLTLAQFRASFLAYVGLEEDTSKLPLPNDSMMVEKTISVSQLSGRTVIEACEEINGCFGHINRDGKFTHIILKPAYGLYPGSFYPGQEYPRSESDTSYLTPSLIDETITTGMRESVRFEEYTTKAIFRLQIRQEEDDIGAIVADTKGVVVDTKTGTSISSTKSEDATADITRIEGNYSQVVTTQGKNLIDLSKLDIKVAGSNTVVSNLDTSTITIECPLSTVPNYYFRSYILKNLVVGQTYVVSANVTGNGITLSEIVGVDEYDSTGTRTKASIKSFVVLEGYTYAIKFYLNNRSTTAIGPIKMTYTNIQLELGSTPTTYSPFVPNSPSPDYPSVPVFPKNFTLNASKGTDSNSKTVTQELRKLPNGVIDTIEKAVDTRYKNRIGKVVFDGSADEGWAYESTNKRYRTSPIPNAVKSDKTHSLAICSHFELLAAGETANAKTGFTIVETGVLYLYKNGESLADFKTWLAANPITVWYELATPTETVIPDITLDTYKGTTTISSNATPQVNITANYFSNTDNTYVIQGNFLVYGKGAEELQTIATNIFGYIAKRPYRPYQSSNIGLPYIEVGDMVEFTQDDPVRGYVFQRVLTGIQALRDEFGADGEEEQTQSFGLNYEIQQLKGKTARIVKTVEQVSATVQDLETDLTGEIAVLAGQVVLKVDTAGNIGYVQLDADPDTDLTSIKLKADNISLEGLVTANNYFKILADGSMEAVNGKFSGNISGGSININNKFVVDSNGYLSATGAIFTDGKITSNGLSGRVEIDGASISGYNTSGGLVLWISANGNINAGTVSATNIVCNSLNGYTPITTGNIGSYASPLGHSHSDYSYWNHSHSTGGLTATTSGGAINFSNVDAVGWVYAHSTFALKSASDQRLKKDIQDLNIPMGLFMKIPTKQFKFKTSSFGKGLYFGVLSQDIEELFKEYDLNPDDYNLFEQMDVRDNTGENEYINDYIHKINYENFIALLINVVQKQDKRIEQLEGKLY